MWAMNEGNFFSEMEIEAHSGAYEMKILSVLIEKYSANDVRVPHKVHLDFPQVTCKFFTKYFAKICRVKRNKDGDTALPYFIFEG